MKQITRYAVNPDGSYVGAFVGLPIPLGSLEVPAAPADGRDIWDFDAEAWTAFQPPTSFPSITARQLRLMLLNIGITPAMVDAEIAAIADAADRETAQIEWEHASVYERTHPLIDQMAAAFSLPATQVDSLWIAAADL